MQEETIECKERWDNDRTLENSSLKTGNGWEGWTVTEETEVMMQSSEKLVCQRN